MKKLSDYKGEEAIELWADILDPLTNIILDTEMRDALNTRPKIEVASIILKKHPKEVSDILLRIDDTPLNGLNIATRLVLLLKDLGESEEVQGFFG